MLFTPRKRRGERPRDGKSQGLYETINSKWYCDCNPRTQAAIRTVKKDNKNKGRRFWTCAQDPQDQCGFFLFEDDARAREQKAREAAELNPPPSTPRYRQTRLTGDSSGGGGVVISCTPRAAPPETPTRRRVVRSIAVTDDDDDDSSPASSDTDAQIARDESLQSAPSYAAAIAARSQRRSAAAATRAASSSRAVGRPSQQQQQATTPSTKKRKYDDDFSDEDFDSDMDRRMAELTDSVAASRSGGGSSTRRIAAGPATTASTTPTKGQKPKQTAAAAAASSSGQGAGVALPPTPVSRNTLLVAREGGVAGSSSRRNKRVRISTPTGGISSPRSSPTPRGAAATAINGGRREEHDDADDGDYDVTREVLALLARHVQQPQPQRAGPAVVPDLPRLRAAVRQSLNSWALRAQGARSSKDILSEGIASRDACIAELREKVAALEKEQAADRHRIAEYREAAKKLLED